MKAPAELPPPVTQAHIEAAFAAMRWYGWSFTAAMREPVLRRQVECRAAIIRTAEWEQTTRRTVIPVKRIKLGADGHPIGWCTQMVNGPLVSNPEPSLF